MRVALDTHGASCLAVVLLLVATTTACGPESIGSREEPLVLRDTLPGGAVLLRYGALPEPIADGVSLDLRIGVLEGDAAEVFGDIRSIEADEDGAIYVLDHQASEVRMFDAGGRFLRTLTRRGQGPSELTAANGMVFDREGTLWIQDHGQWRFIGVNRLGEEIGRVPMHILSYGYVWDGTVDNRGRFWKPVSHSDQPPVFPPDPGLLEQRARSYAKWLDPMTGESDSVFMGEVTQRMHVTRTANGGWMNRAIPFSHRPIELVDPRGGFWLASEENYRVVRLGESGDTVLVLEVDVAPEQVTSQDRERFIESTLEQSPDQRRAIEEMVSLAPQTKPVIDQLILDDEGRLWVRRRTAEDAEVRYDLFAREGEYLGSMRLPFRPSPYLPPRIRHGNLYALTTDSLGVHSVVRARLLSLQTN